MSGSRWREGRRGREEEGCPSSLDKTNFRKVTVRSAPLNAEGRNRVQHWGGKVSRAPHDGTLYQPPTRHLPVRRKLVLSRVARYFPSLVHSLGPHLALRCGVQLCDVICGRSGLLFEISRSQRWDAVEWWTRHRSQFMTMNIKWTINWTREDIPHGPRAKDWAARRRRECSERWKSKLISKLN